MSDWQPRLVALDIDGTLLKWIEGSGQSYEVIPPRVYDAVHRAFDAGAHIVLASGRSPHGMTRIADLLDLPRDGADRLWVVASNGAVVFRYPPVEVVHEEKFDAAPAVAAVLAHHPRARVAIEERGRGYRVSKPFPHGELSGVQFITSVHQMVAEPVSRVIIRDPDGDRRGLRRPRRPPRPARHRLRRRLDRVARPRADGGLQGLRSRPRDRRASTWSRPTCSRSATAATTSRCSSGPAAGWRWARPSRRCTTRPTRAPRSVYDDGAAVEIDRWFDGASAPVASPATRPQVVPEEL